MDEETEVSWADEASRIKVLEEIWLMNLPNLGESFNRYTSLAQRLFDTSSAHVLIIGTVQQNMILSSSGLFSKTDVELISLNSNNVASANGDICIVEDVHNVALRDESLSGIPSIKFYASAPIILENTQVGSFILCDDKPRRFDDADKASLFDIAEIIADIIRGRRRAALDRQRARIEMMNMLMHNFRTPLAAVEMSVSILRNADMDGNVGTMTLGDESLAGTLSRWHSKDGVNEINSSKNGGDMQPEFVQEELLAAIGHLVLLVESSMTLAEVVTDDSATGLSQYQKYIYTTPAGGRRGIRSISSVDYSKIMNSSIERNWSRLSRGSRESISSVTSSAIPSRRCDLVGKILDAQRKVGAIFSRKRFHVKWDVDHESFVLGSRSHPSMRRTIKIVYFLLLRNIEYLMGSWHSAEVVIQFAQDETSTFQESEESANKLVNDDGPTSSSSGGGAAPLPNGAGSAERALPQLTKTGKIHIAFEGTGRRKENKSNAYASEAHLSSYSIEDILREINGGSTSHRDDDKEYISVWLPYTVTYCLQPSPPPRRTASASNEAASPSPAPLSRRASRMNSRASFYPDTDRPGGSLPTSPSKQSSGIWTTVPTKPSSPPSMSPKALSRRTSRASFMTSRSTSSSIIVVPLRDRELSSDNTHTSIIDLLEGSAQDQSSSFNYLTGSASTCIMEELIEAPNEDKDLEFDTIHLLAPPPPRADEEPAAKSTSTSVNGKGGSPPKRGRKIVAKSPSSTSTAVSVQHEGTSTSVTSVSALTAATDIDDDTSDMQKIGHMMLPLPARGDGNEDENEADRLLELGTVPVLASRPNAPKPSNGRSPRTASSAAIATEATVTLPMPESV
jgi:signal transduction histidine kinase